MENTAITYRGLSLPCRFLPAERGRKSPVLIMVSGGEGITVDLYFWAGAYALANGYSILLYEGPGNISTMYTSGLVHEADSSRPIGAALDWLCERNDVDTERIALMGISFGGYLASRAAAVDPRIKALIPDSPVLDFFEILLKVYPKWIFSLPEWFFRFFLTRIAGYYDRAGFDLLLWEGGASGIRELFEELKEYRMGGLESKIACPVFGMTGDGEGETFTGQAREFIERVASREKRLRIYTKADGAGAHCQMDNQLIMNQELVAWLDRVFDLEGKRG
jgi:pimeloyl-ACP methyl ester carboxylesterase